MKLILLFLALAVVVVLFLSMRKRRDAGDTRAAIEENPRLSDSSEFHAVSLKAGSNSCAEAREIDGKRLLASSAPRIPLPACDAADCRCRFIHHTDRRGGDDRRTPYPSPIGLETGVYGEDQRKDERDRRDDPPNAF